MPAASSAAPAYEGLLKRKPAQRRSAARLEAVLDASDHLIAEGGLEALTMRAVADRAGVPTGTIYQSFADRDTLIQALAVRYVSATPSLLEKALADSPPWSGSLDRLVDLYAAMLRDQPAMRILWLAGAMDPPTRQLAVEADDLVATRLRRELGDAAPSTRTATEADWRFLVTMVSGLLKLAFANDPAGDREILMRTKRAACLYAADLMGVSPP